MQFWNKENSNTVQPWNSCTWAQKTCIQPKTSVWQTPSLCCRQSRGSSCPRYSQTFYRRAASWGRGGSPGGLSPWGQCSPRCPLGTRQSPSWRFCRPGGGWSSPWRKIKFNHLADRAVVHYLGSCSNIASLYKENRSAILIKFEFFLRLKYKNVFLFFLSKIKTYNIHTSFVRYDDLNKIIPTKLNQFQCNAFLCCFFLSN